MCKLMAIFLIGFAWLASPAFAKDWSGKVVGVTDGDTVTVLHDGVPQKVRLAGIDCPEKSQDFGQRAKNFTSEQCFGKSVTIIERGHDRYGRTIGDLISGSGTNVNQELVRSGLAWHYLQFSKDAKLAQLEAEARAEQRELWQDKNAIAPWKFRKQRK
ncbi:MAG: thermonuclease family protein [Candidatus Obscuribacterales bacterium]|nr:thermonuclease family protein [Candidatus Obscuribacterales bacterium]